MNKLLRLAVRNPSCVSCKLHKQADGIDRCVTGEGPNKPVMAIVTKFPLAPTGKTRAELLRYLEEAGIDAAKVMFLSALKCRTWDLDPSKGDQKACKPYLDAELNHIKPKYVMALGGEALFAATGKAGIMKYRGKIFDHSSGAQVYATISPSMVVRSPGLRPGFMANLVYFRKLATGMEGDRDPFHVPGPDRRTYVGDKDALRAFLRAIDRASVGSYDIETTGAAEHEPGAAVISIAVTLAGKDGMKSAHVWEVPLFHPESPWRDVWVRILNLISNRLARVKRLVAHNAKYDTKWMTHFQDGQDQPHKHIAPTFDTIIAAALINENQPKGLKPLSQTILGADPWGVDTAELLKMALAEVLEYNGLDTWHTLRLYYHFRAELLKQPKTARLFAHLMMPAVRELVYVERVGVYVDQERLHQNWAQAKGVLERIHDELYDLIPDDVNDFPDNLFNKQGELQVNWNASNFARWFLFEYLDLPVIARGKTKENGDPGDPSMAESVMMELAETSPVAKLLLERVEWNKFDTAFFKPYSEQIDPNGRIHSTFKPWGTVTGRLSSGKEDAEKVTNKAQTRGVNLQQVPRKQIIRGVFGAAPGYVFIEADYSQIELRIAAFLARETTMLHLYATGQDIHMAMAMRMTGKPASQVTKEERKRAKAVNFGFLYGMGWAKFIDTAWSNYALRVTEFESKAFRTSFFAEFPRLLPWHGRQRKLAHTYGRVETPMGRIRHLPDIYSPEQGVRSEAERQAINSPVQGMASDMALLSLVHTARAFRKQGIEGWPIGTVHDAVNFEIARKDVPRAARLIKHTMENLPLERMFDLNVDVPIVADLKMGKHWGGSSEVPPELLTVDDESLRNWLEENVPV